MSFLHIISYHSVVSRHTLPKQNAIVSVIYQTGVSFAARFACHKNDKSGRPVVFLHTNTVICGDQHHISCPDPCDPVGLHLLFFLGLWPDAAYIKQAPRSFMINSLPTRIWWGIIRPLVMKAVHQYRNDGLPCYDRQVYQLSHMTACSQLPDTSYHSPVLSGG